MSDQPKSVHFEPFPFGRPDYLKNTCPPEPTPSFHDEQARRDELLAQDRRMAEARRKHFIEGDYWMQEIITECKEAGEPIRIMELVNRVANNTKFPSWTVKVARKRELLKLISVMLRQGRLERWGRKHVTIPQTDEKFKSWMASGTKPLDLPDPMLA